MTREVLLRLVREFTGGSDVDQRIVKALRGEGRRKGRFVTNLFRVSETTFIVLKPFVDGTTEVPQWPLLLKTHDCTGAGCSACREITTQYAQYGFVSGCQIRTSHIARVFQSRFGDSAGETFVPFREDTVFTGGDICLDGVKEPGDGFTYFDLNAVPYGGSVFLYSCDGLWVFTLSVHDDHWYVMFEPHPNIGFQRMLAQAMEAVEQ